MEEGSIEWNMEGNFTIKWNMEWKKLASMEYGKIEFHFIPYYALLVRYNHINKVTWHTERACLNKPRFQ